MRAINDLTENLRQQEKICRDMRQLARRQLQSVVDAAAGEPDGDSILRERAKLAEELRTIAARARLIERELAERLALQEFTLKGLAGQVEADAHWELEQAFDRVGGLLREVLALDDRTTELMRSRLRAFKGLRQPAANCAPARAQQAYRDASPPKKE